MDQMENRSLKIHIANFLSDGWNCYKLHFEILATLQNDSYSVKRGTVGHIISKESEDLSVALTKNPSIHTASHCGEKEKDPTVLGLLNLRQGLIPISKRNKMKGHKFMTCRKQDACIFTSSSRLMNRWKKFFFKLYFFYLNDLTKYYNTIIIKSRKRNTLSLLSFCLKILNSPSFGFVIIDQ